MDIAKVIAHLRRELELVDHAIRLLEPLVSPTTRRRGRPGKRISLYRQLPNVPDPVRQIPARRAPGNKEAASAEGAARKPESEGSPGGGDNQQGG
jgi:hypothetical protein